MSFFFKKLFVTALLSSVIVLASGCTQSIVGNGPPTGPSLPNVQLEYWRVWDGQAAFESIISAYKAIHPEVSIRYRKLRFEEYEQELLEAMAAGRGPDIISLHAEWLPRYQDRLVPLPAAITLPYQVVEGSVKKEVVIKQLTNQSITSLDIQNDFSDVVHDDVVLDGEIYGLPLSVDTMVLYYNRDLFNVGGINAVPQYWNEDFLQAVKALTSEDANGQIVQSAVALGTSDNIQRYSDILSLLMMQNGVQMTDERGNIAFHRQPPGSTSRDYAPGPEALRFYTDFANPLKEVYTWNAEMPDSITAFVEGRVAMVFGYAYHLPTIRAQAPRLNLGISPMLQIEGNREVNFANYWVETVSHQSEHPDYAWDFLQFAANADNVTGYLEAAQKPTALRSLVSEQREDPNLGVFANQLLTATSWYRGKDYNAAEAIMGDMIDTVVRTPDELNTAMGVAARKIQQTTR